MAAAMPAPLPFASVSMWTSGCPDAYAVAQISMSGYSNVDPLSDSRVCAYPAASSHRHNTTESDTRSVPRFTLDLQGTRPRGLLIGRTILFRDGLRYGSQERSPEDLAFGLPQHH